MVNQVHFRWDEENPVNLFEPYGKSDFAVMELGCEDYKGVEYDEDQNLRAENEYQLRPDEHRHGYFTEVKTGSSCDIEIQVAVMDLMKPPEKWNDVINQMPDIKKKVQKNNTQKNFNPWRKR